MEMLKIFAVSYVEDGGRNYLFFATKKRAEAQLESWRLMDEDVDRDYIFELYPKTKDDLCEMLQKFNDDSWEEE